MKYLNSIFLYILFSTIGFAQVWVVDPLEAVYPDRNSLTEYTSRWKTDVVNGHLAEAIILIKLPKNTSFNVEMTLNGKSLPNKYLFELQPVPVEQNTGLDSRTEQYKGNRNPHVIRRAPFEIFEVIKPVQSLSFNTKYNFSAFRIAISSELFHSDKKNTVRIAVHSAEKTFKGRFDFKIHKVAQLSSSEEPFFYTNWFNLKRMEEAHGVARWTDDWYEILNKYAALMAHGRQNSITIPHELIKYENGQFSLDEDKMLRFIDVFRKHGFRFFEAPHLLNRGAEDDWGDPELKVALSKKRYYKENGKEDIAKIMKLIHDFTTKNNLNDSWLQHISDEPTAVNAKCYLDAAAQIKSIFPEVRIMEATNARDPLVGAIDIWCPIIDDFQLNERFFRERESQGERVLVYTCLVPGGPWLNRTLDMEKLRQVYFGWGSAHYNTGGYLHWGLNQYYANPFEQSVVKHPSPVAGPTNYLPAGDTHIIYPGEDGPLSSLRFEAHRIGIEDYDLLQLLKRKNSTDQKRVVSKLFKNYTDYELDLKKYRKTRRKLLQKL